MATCDIANCTVSQTDSMGEVRGLCWAACATSVINYCLYGYQKYYAYNIADKMGIDYDEGGNINDIVDALSYYDVDNYRGSSIQIGYNSIMLINYVA